MSNDDPLGVDLPAPVRQRLDLSLAPDDLVPEDPHRLGESPAEAAERHERALAAAARIREDRELRWARLVPERFKDCDLPAASLPAPLSVRLTDWHRRRDVLTLTLWSEEPGVGKTTAAYSLCNAACADGAWVYGGSMIDLNDAFRPGGPTANVKSTVDAYTTAQECDLLLLDDLGRERVTDWTVERLTGILDARWREKRRTIITTNLSGVEFAARYGDPIVDRVTDDAWRIKVEGTSHRARAPW